MAVTWNPSDKHADITLSNGDLDATFGPTWVWQMVRATQGRSTGKYYFELYIVAANDLRMVGVATSAASLSNFVGADAYGWGLDGSATNDLYTGGSAVGTSGLGPKPRDSTIRVAVDLDANKLWFGLDGTWQGNPAAGTGASFTGIDSGTLFPAVSGVYSNDTVRGRFVSADFAYSPPSGFSAWDDGTGGGVAVTPSPISSVASALIGAVLLGSLAITPAPASAVSSRVGPVVEQGSIAVTPAPAATVQGAVDPAVIVAGDQTIAPASASAVGATVAPAVGQSSVPVTPAAGSAVGSKVDPGVELGSLALVPAPASGISSTIDPAVVQGAVSVTPSPASSIGSRVNPSVVLWPMPYLALLERFDGTLSNWTLDLSGGIVDIQTLDFNPMMRLSDTSAGALVSATRGFTPPDGKYIIEFDMRVTATTGHAFMEVLDAADNVLFHVGNDGSLSNEGEFDTNDAAPTGFDWPANQAKMISVLVNAQTARCFFSNGTGDTWTQNSWLPVSAAKNFTGTPAKIRFRTTAGEQTTAYIDEVKVYKCGTFVIGDSITAGEGQPGVSDRWNPNPRHGSRTSAQVSQTHEYSYKLGQKYSPARWVANRGISGDSAQWIDYDIDNRVIQQGATEVVILVGTNDISGGVPLATIEGYIQSAASKAAAAGLQILLCSVPPNQWFNATQNANRDTLNTWIQSHCAANGYRFVDLYTALKDSTDPDILNPAYDAGDGVHLSHAGLEAVANAVIAATPPVPASAVAATVGPTVMLGSVSVTPAPASSVQGGVNPAVTITIPPITPTPASGVGATVPPAVVLGSLSITPSAGSALGNTVDPGVALGSVSVVPAPTSAVQGGVDPTSVLGSVSVAPSPGSAVGAMVDPVVTLGSISIAPAAGSAVGGTINPAVVVSSFGVVTPMPASGVAVTVNPAVIMGSITVTPAPAIAVQSGVDPIISGMTIYEVISQKVAVVRSLRDAVHVVRKITDKVETT